MHRLNPAGGRVNYIRVSKLLRRILRTAVRVAAVYTRSFQVPSNQR